MRAWMLGGMRVPLLRVIPKPSSALAVPDVSSTLDIESVQDHKTYASDI